MAGEAGVESGHRPLSPSHLIPTPLSSVTPDEAPLTQKQKFVHIKCFFELHGLPTPLPWLWQALVVSVLSVLPSQRKKSTFEPNARSPSKMLKKGVSEGLLRRHCLLYDCNTGFRWAKGCLGLPMETRTIGSKAFSDELSIFIKT